MLCLTARLAAAASAVAMLAAATAARADELAIQRQRSECESISQRLTDANAAAQQLITEGKLLASRDQAWRVRLGNSAGLTGDQINAASVAYAQFILNKQAELERLGVNDPRRPVAEEQIVEAQAIMQLLREDWAVVKEGGVFNPLTSSLAKLVSENNARLAVVVRDLALIQEGQAKYTSQLSECRAELQRLHAQAAGDGGGLPVAVASSGIADGRYASMGGLLTFSKQADSVAGTYVNQGQTVWLRGTLNGAVLSGVWTSDIEGSPCQTPVDGKLNWGKFSFTFTADGFRGASGFCDEAPHLAWDGARQR